MYFILCFIKYFILCSIKFHFTVSLVIKKFTINFQLITAVVYGHEVLFLPRNNKSLLTV